MLLNYRKFAVSGALKKLQEIRNSPDPDTKQLATTAFNTSIERINSYYKEEMLALFRNKEEILKKLEVEANNT